MRGMLAVVLCIALTAMCWGIYGPVLHVGQEKLGVAADAAAGTRAELSFWRAFIGVGLAYFVIAVLIPTIYLQTKGEKGSWTVGGTLMSIGAGAAGAVGALGIIMAFVYRGSPIYVMPLVFGFAPVVNSFVTMYFAKSYKETNAIFWAGLLLVVAGAVTVLLFKPTATVAAAVSNAGGGAAGALAVATDTMMVTISVAIVALCWGSYGPLLHKGQAAMHGSRLRPFICVGLAYFLVAVVVPLVVLGLKSTPEPGGWNFGGTAWSLGAGAAGAFGALGIIMAFNFGGKPVYVMPLVFGCAPVINVSVSVISQISKLREGQELIISPIFYAGLIVVAVGAVTVLVFAPKPHKPAAAKAEEPAKVETAGAAS
jgi:hypothetical protein